MKKVFNPYRLIIGHTEDRIIEKDSAMPEKYIVNDKKYKDKKQVKKVS